MATLDAKLLWESYRVTGSIHRTGVLFGVHGETARRVLLEAGYRLDGSKWSDVELARLKDYYATVSYDDFAIAILAQELGRSWHSIALKASRLKLTDPRGVASANRSAQHKQANCEAIKNRGYSLEERRARSIRAKQMHAVRGHPRGMLGKTHTPEVRARLSAAHKEKWASFSQTDKRNQIDSMLRGKARRNGGVLPAARGFGSWKSGWAEVGGKRCFFRSLWEKNYAHFLEHLKGKKLITEWEHEPRTFWFDAVKRGSNNYTPDFRVMTWDGAEEYHEVKGWMDERSKMKLRRMRTHFPTLTLIVRDSAWFKANRDLEFQVPGWQTLSQRKVQKGEEEGAEVSIFPPGTW